MPHSLRLWTGSALAIGSLLIGTSIVGAGAAQAAVSPTASVVINEVYGGGGNSGAQYNRDFIELRNARRALRRDRSGPCSTGRRREVPAARRR